MARSTKTQQDSGKKSADGSSPEQIARHFMQIWQDQWQAAMQQFPLHGADGASNVMPGFHPGGFGFPAGFGQNPNHAATPSPSAAAPDALELATAALAASEQCLELLKQCSQWMDGINRRITALEHDAGTNGPRTKPARKPASSAKAKR